MAQLWVDADACPRNNKDLVCRSAVRTGIAVCFVAGRHMFTPAHPLITMVAVGDAFSAADEHIIAQSQAGDLVITDDVPLAAALVDKGVRVISNRGRVFTPENVKEALTMRNLMQELRGGLEQTGGGGPAPMGPKNFEQFANALDRELAKTKK